MGLLDALKGIFGGSSPAKLSSYTDDFNRLFSWLMEWEGTAYENDPSDPGGATKYGIDQRSHPRVNIRALTEDAAKAIYLQEWDEDGCAKLPRPASEVYFNFCVNCGKARAQQFYNTAIKAGSPVAIALAMIAAADRFYTALRRPRFLQGWLNRDASLRKFIS
jgi:Glycosyl hydrolase 108